MTIKILPCDGTQAPNKLADVELHWDPGPTTFSEWEGLKLMGFAVWQKRIGQGRNVTFPARQYRINGERRSFDLLRPIDDARAGDELKQLILAAYVQWEANHTPICSECKLATCPHAINDDARCQADPLGAKR